MANIFKAPAILTRIAYTKDRGLSLGFSTQELSDEEKVKAAQFHQQFGYLLFRENEFTPDDIPKEDADVFGVSSSKRLYNVFFVWWKQLPEPKAEFATFYRHQMEQIINKVKEKLD